MADRTDAAEELFTDELVADAMAACLNPLAVAADVIGEHFGETHQQLLTRALLLMFADFVLCHASTDSEAFRVAQAITGGA